jgi:hypothetical protein
VREGRRLNAFNRELPSIHRTRHHHIGQHQIDLCARANNSAATISAERRLKSGTGLPQDIR